MALVQEYIKGINKCLEEIDEGGIEEIAGAIFNAYKRGNRIFILGNGGSATTASHFARDLQIGAAAKGKPRIPATSLTDNIAFITALANDIDYSAIFTEQLIGQLQKGDVVIGISASGNSPNVLKAIAYARENGAETIGFIGFGGGKLKKLADKAVILSNKDYGLVEDVHAIIAHLTSYLVREKVKES